jgi:hypothetical protein
VLHPARAGWRERSNKSLASEDDLSGQLSCPASTDTVTLAKAGTNAAAVTAEDMPVERIEGLQAKFKVR